MARKRDVFSHEGKSKWGGLPVNSFMPTQDNMRLTLALLLGIMKGKTMGGGAQNPHLPQSSRHGVHSRPHVPRPHFRVALHIIIPHHGKKVHWHNTIPQHLSNAIRPQNPGPFATRYGSVRTNMGIEEVVMPMANRSVPCLSRRPRVWCVRCVCLRARVCLCVCVCVICTFRGRSSCSVGLDAPFGWRLLRPLWNVGPLPSAESQPLWFAG